MKIRLIMSIAVGVAAGIVGVICKKASQTRVPLVLPVSDRDYAYNVRKALYSVVALDGELLIEVITRAFINLTGLDDSLLDDFVLEEEAVDLVIEVLELTTNKTFCFHVDLDINTKTINIILEHLCEEGILLEDGILTLDDYGNIIDDHAGYKIVNARVFVK